MFRNALFPDSTNVTAKPHPHRHTHAQMGAHIRTFKVQIERMLSSSERCMHWNVVLLSLHVLLACPLILHISAISFTLILFCIYSIITPMKKMRHSVASCCDAQISCKTHLPVNLYHEFQPAHSSLFFLFSPSVCISKSASKEGTVCMDSVSVQTTVRNCLLLSVSVENKSSFTTCTPNEPASIYELLPEHLPFENINGHMKKTRTAKNRHKKSGTGKNMFTSQHWKKNPFFHLIWHIKGNCTDVEPL